ncbi:MAG: sulfotransferase domain-containing protein [Nanoarchaeota archaeon]|nr:sulfotransferase domain-containing protein [Nanoarchaeota archaeon]MBU1320861.1 sulfotransferase domain-containing protein [Nanoarchaeota archaeon]MBU1597927.1 sulfotransferase domain-containing protein [Nanoarchaeota archaeon]MBU2441337.1 sulfotransferase domain-containing protein [Nanoarchaeota archaeon]
MMKNLIRFLPNTLFWFFKSKTSKGNKGKLPDFLIIGTQKSGTTSLWANLRQHKDIEMSPYFKPDPEESKNTKEVHFFDYDKNWYKTKAWYKQLFNDNNKLQGEATPTYILFPESCKRMYKTVPNAKLIIVLRNPVTRAYSAFNHYNQGYKKNKNVKKWDWYLPGASFEENILAEKKDKYKKGIARTGFYINQIKEILKYYPREQIHIIIAERMKKNMKKTYKEVYEFLGVKQFMQKFLRKIQTRRYKEPIKTSTANMLEKLYSPYNKKLFAFLGYKIKEWK